MTDESTIFVLTDTPAVYGSDLYLESHPSVFIKDIPTLLTRLGNAEIAGLVLEVPKVMKASRTDRDRLFEYASCHPVLRTRPNARHGFMVYLDPRDHFLANVTDRDGKRKRNFERIPVELECQVSREHDPSMAEVLEATILDISPAGCFIKTDNLIGEESFVNLRVPALGSNRPIYSSVRWSRPENASGAKIGMGLLFIDITDEQTDAVSRLG